MLNVNTIIQLHCTVAGKIPVNKISKERMYLAAYTGSIYVYIYVCVYVCIVFVTNSCVVTFSSDTKAKFKLCVGT